MRRAVIHTVLLAAILSLSACGQSDEQQASPPSIVQPQAQVAPSQPNVSNTPPQQQATVAAAPAQAVRLDQPVAAPANQNYTFRGTVLLPPDSYMSGQNVTTLNETSICGVTSFDQPTSEKYCFKFEEFFNHLYDADHAALDVWDVRDDWYLLLTQKDRREVWVEKAKFGVYHPYADVIKQKLLFLGDWSYETQPTWPLQAYSAPEGQVIELSKDKYPNMKSRNPMVAITSVAQSSKKELWFKLNLINSLCETTQGADTQPVVMDVWFPAYRLDDKTGLYVPTVWYYAKGC